MKGLEGLTYEKRLKELNMESLTKWWYYNRLQVSEDCKHQGNEEII